MDEFSALMEKAIKEYSADEMQKHVEYFNTLGEKWSGTPDKEIMNNYYLNNGQKRPLNVHFPFNSELSLQITNKIRLFSFHSQNKADSTVFLRF